MAAEVRIWLLGGFRVGLDSRTVPDEAWRRNKAKAVVKLLALAPSHRLHREQLMDLLWPELAPDAAAANLRKAVHFARQALAPEHLRLRQEVLQLGAERLWVDVQAFQAAAQAGDLAAAIDLYGGELLPEDRFEPWAEQHREQLGARFSRLLLERAVELEAGGDLRGAAGALERLVAVDPLNEPAAATGRSAPPEGVRARPSTAIASRFAVPRTAIWAGTGWRTSRSTLPSQTTG
jgi:DNA-binding SARP family transcriptional activator